MFSDALRQENAAPRRHGGHPHSHWLDGETATIRVSHPPGTFDDRIAGQADSGELVEDTVVVTDDIHLRLRLGGRVVCRDQDGFYGRSRGRR